MEQRRIVLRGHQFAYLAACPAGNAPAVLLIHGMAGSSAMWRPVIPGLAEHYRVIAPDLLGHGDSDKPRTDYSLGAFASDLRDLLAALRVARATLVGQSFGGGVAMQLAYQYPECCERLVLVASGGLGEEVHPLLRALTMPGADWLLEIGCASPLVALGERALKWLGRVGWRPGPVLTEVGRSYSSLTDADARHAFLHTLRSVVDRQGQCVSARDKMRTAAEMPTLILWGRRDRVIPIEHAIHTHAAMPGSHIVLFERAGHFLQVQDPDRFVSVVDGFIRGSAPCTASHAHRKTAHRRHRPA